MSERFFWTEARIATLRDLVSQGLIPSQIAERMGTTRDAVGKKASRLSLSIPRKFEFDWTPERIDVLRSTADANLPAAHAAALLGISRNAVLGKSARLGITFWAPSGRAPKAPKQPPKNPVRRSLNFIWSPKPVERLIELSAAGVASPVIAETLSREFTRTLSASAVRAKAVKLGIVLKAVRGPTKTPRPKIVRPKPQPVVVEAPNPLLVSFFDIQHGQCRFPIGEPTDLESFRFCGAEASRGSYCAGHHQLCHGRS